MYGQNYNQNPNESYNLDTQYSPLDVTFISQVVI